MLEPAGRWSAPDLVALLTAPDGEEWRHKVGVAGPSDGSAKTTTRLVAVRGQVCKTRVDDVAPSADAARARLVAARTAGMAAGVWHPQKVWALLRSDDGWHPLTVCPELMTLRQIRAVHDRWLAWITMIQASIDVHVHHGLGFDLNPANFGFEAPGGRLYYLDDEFYATLDARNVAGAIVARIPEEPEAEAETWRAWGAELRRRLEPGALSWDAIRDELRLYPLPERFEGRRAALLRELADSPARSSRAPALTCVLADVHANLPALEAVLSDARARGADSYLFLGDAIGYGPHPAECVRLLAELPRAVLIRGNHDHAIATGRFDLGMNSLARQCAEWTRAALGADELAWLRALPTEQIGDGWLAVHGAPQDPHRFLAYVYELTYEDNLRYLRQQRIPVCFYGHTHVQLTHLELAAGLKKLPGPRTLALSPRHHSLVNPGSVGQPRDGDARAAYALWRRTTSELTTFRVAYDVERTVAALAAAALPGQLASRLRAGA